MCDFIIFFFLLHNLHSLLSSHLYLWGFVLFSMLISFTHTAQPNGKHRDLFSHYNYFAWLFSVQRDFRIIAASKYYDTKILRWIQAEELTTVGKVLNVIYRSFNRKRLFIDVSHFICFDFFKCFEKIKRQISERDIVRLEKCLTILFQLKIIDEVF